MKYSLLIPVLFLPLIAISQDEKEKDEKKPKVFREFILKVGPDGKVFPLDLDEQSRDRQDSLDKLLSDLRSGDNEKIESAYRKILELLGRIQDSLDDSKEKFTDEAELLQGFLKQVIKLRTKRYVKDLVSADSKAKDRAKEELLNMGDEILELLEKETTEKNKESIEKIIEQIKSTKDNILKQIELLGNDDPEQRQKAKDELKKVGKAAKPYLKLFKNDKDQEIKTNVNSLLEELVKKEEKTSKDDTRTNQFGKKFVFPKPIPEKE